MKLLVVIGFCALVSLIEGRIQSVGVRGTLMCGKEPLVDTVVKLWDDDSWFDPDDLMACNRTDKKGNFVLQGFEDETTNIDPRLKIYTNCNDRTLFQLVGKPCQRKIRTTIPDSYINSGKTVTKWFDAGVLNMELKQKDEDRSCTVFEDC